MRNYLRSILTRARQGAAAFLVGLGIGSFLVGPAALALVLPPQYAPRQFPSQQVHYLRFAINFNSCPLPASAGNCSFKVGALPYNSYLLRGSYQVYTAFNSTTTDTFNIGTASGGTQIVSASPSTHSVVAGTALTIVAANVGTAATGNGIAQTGSDGGFDVWVTIAYTGATAASAGAAVGILEYIAPNDGSCIYVPMAQTSPGC